MKIGIIDADLIGRRNHNFPNLACMKISDYYKSKGYEVVRGCHPSGTPRCQKMSKIRIK